MILDYSDNLDITSNLESSGYAIVRSVIDSEKIRRVEARLTSDLAGLSDDLRQLSPPENLEELGKWMSKIGQSPDRLNQAQKSLMAGHFPFDTRMCEEIKDVLTDKSLLGLLTRLFSQLQINVHLPPMARFVLPGNENAGVPPHQDIIYNNHMDDFVTVWLPIVEVDEKCGGVNMYHDPKSPLPPPPPSTNQVWFESQSTQDMEFTSCVPMKPGDVLIFTNTTLHGSMNNISNRIRFSLDLRYFPENSKKHYMNVMTGKVYEPAQ